MQAANILQIMEEHGSPDVLGFDLPFYLVYQFCAFLICQAFRDIPHMNTVCT